VSGTATGCGSAGELPVATVLAIGWVSTVLAAENPYDHSFDEFVFTKENKIA
jgi:hypothetical protein